MEDTTTEGFDIFQQCPNVLNGGKEDCDSIEECECSQDGETVCIFGICVCMHQRHLAFDKISCSDENHALVLKNTTHGELNCPQTCLATSESNSCPPSSMKGDDGKCYCVGDNSRVFPEFTADHKLDLPFPPFDVCSSVPKGTFTLHNYNSTTPAPGHFASSLSLLYLIIPVSILICAVLGVFTIYWKYFNRHRPHSSISGLPFLNWKRTTNDYELPEAPINNTDNTLPITMFPPNSKMLIPLNMEDNPTYFSTEYLIQSKARGKQIFSDKLITNDKIEKGKRIGNGQFGEVYKGTYHGPTGAQEVAIKIPKITWNTGCSPLEVENLKSFYAEAQITLGFDHGNVLSCLGISTGASGEPWMVVEFMRFGDLADVLRTNSGVLSLQRSDSPILEMVDLLRISYQIACGMDYLSGQHFTHRDLAARNCLVGENLLVKISDFGLTRDIYASEYYKITGSERLLPVRWMAPESITHGKFTNETDIWSYGVVLWEIFTFGKVPYYLLSNKEVMEGVSLGQHLNPPEGCPEVIKSLMLSCWEHTPSDRIRFSNISETLSEDNLKASTSHSSSLYAKLCPVDYKEKYRLSMSNHVDRRNKDMLNNSSEKRPEKTSSWPTPTSISPLISKNISTTCLAESPELTANPNITPETQYTVILANTEDLEEEIK